VDNILFTATGCTRCKIVKQFIKEKGISFIEKDIKVDGKEDFQKFYAANRKAIYRGPDGVEFPVFFDGVEIRQGLGPIIAYLHSGKKLDGFARIGTLHKEWVDGLHVSGGDPAYAEEFLAVLRYLKDNNMKLQVETNGKNSKLLQQILQEKLASVVIMDVKGPKTLYSQILGEIVDVQDIEKSIALVPQFPKYQFQTTVAPVLLDEGEKPVIRYLTPEEIAETARMIEEVTGSKKHPYLIRLFNPEKAADERLRAVKPLHSNDLLRYRMAARAYQVLADIEKA